MRKQINRRLQPPLLVARSSGTGCVREHMGGTTASQIQCRKAYSDDMFFAFLSSFYLVLSGFYLRATFFNFCKTKSENKIKQDSEDSEDQER